MHTTDMNMCIHTLTNKKLQLCLLRFFPEGTHELWPWILPCFFLVLSLIHSSFICGMAWKQDTSNKNTHKKKRHI